jgi:hypothetical protein
MSKGLCIVALIAWLLLGSETSQAQQGNAVLLPESGTKELLRLRYLNGPAVGGYWRPTQEDISKLESSIPKIADLRSESALVGMQIAQPAKDNRQYVAVMVNSRKTIYVNGFCMPPSSTWTSRLEVIMDGGTCVWHVLYDVERQTFSHLTVNGRG